MNILNCIFVIIGTIIGAGFSSGKEIYSFFFIHGKNGILGLIISIFLIGYIIFKSLSIIKKYDINNYEEFLKRIIDKKEMNIGAIINIIINTFLLITFYIMCAGFSAYFNQEFGINILFSGAVIAIISYVLLNKNMNGIFFINSILIPLIILILIVLGVRSGKNIENFTNTTNFLRWFPSAILYASYNTVTLISILIPMKRYINNKMEIIKVTICSIIIIFIMAFIIILLLLSIKNNIDMIELPAVYASRTFWRFL